MAARAFALLLLPVACASSAPLNRLRSNAAFLGPADFLPNDLDFVVRIDADRMRGEPAIDAAARELAKSGGSAMLRSILPIVARARAIFVGGRFMGDGFHGDGVVAIETGAVAKSEKKAADPSFHRVARTNDDVAIFERAADARDEAVLEIVLDQGGVVLATAAEADSVLRVARLGPDPDRLDPPARGLASFAGRNIGEPASGSTSGAIDGEESSRASGANVATAPVLRRIAQGLTRYSGSVDGGDAWHIETDLVYSSAEAAARATAWARSFLDRLRDGSGAMRSLADSVKLDREEQVLRVRASVPFAVMKKLD